MKVAPEGDDDADPTVDSEADSSLEKSRPPVVRNSIKVASAMIALFCLFNALDAYTTEVGLSRGGREINVVSAGFISTFGVEGYVIGKVAVSIVAGIISIIVWRSWHRLKEYVFDFYLAVSLALVIGAIAPVINNLIVLLGL